MRANGVIIGAGIVGSATAYELSRRGMKDLHVIDPDLEGSLSSTERNAGGVRHLWQHAVNRELSKASISLFESIKNEIGFQQLGYLWLFSNKNAAQNIYSIAKTLSYEFLTPAEIQKRCPFIDKTNDLSAGIFGPNDGLINPNALKKYFQEEAKKQGVKFHDRKRLTKFVEKPTTITLEIAPIDANSTAECILKNPIAQTPNETWQTEKLLLCAGAWMESIYRLQGETPISKPIRRQICCFKADDVDLSPYGMIVDTSRVYFHADGGNIISGKVLKEEEPGYRFHFDESFFEDHIWPALFNRSSQFERLKLISGWAGLYSYTPDASGIIDRFAKCKNVFEVHSFTGRGVMQSYGAAIAAADLVLEGKFKTIDAGPLSRSRFSDKSKWLVEGLHI